MIAHDGVHGRSVAGIGNVCHLHASQLQEARRNQMPEGVLAGGGIVQFSLVGLGVGKVFAQVVHRQGGRHHDANIQRGDARHRR